MLRDGQDLTHWQVAADVQVERGMDTVVSYFATFASDFAAALPAKAVDPVGWIACAGGLLLGIASTWWRPRSWVWALVVAALIVLVRTLADTYSAPVTGGDNTAFAFIMFVGVLAGTLLVRPFRRKSV
jgi:hypothetical protein